MRPTSLLLILLAGGLFAGCNSIRLGGQRSVSAENDRLRARVQEQHERIATLEGERAELLTKLQQSQQSREGALPSEVIEAIPTVTDVRVSMLSGLEPIDAAHPATGLSVTLQTLDGRGRFTQAVGAMTIEGFMMPAKVGEGEPQRIARRAFTPGQLRDAYRSDLTGTYYALSLPLDAPIDRSMGTPSILVRLEFADALTGQVHKAERLLAPRPPAHSGGQ